MFQKARLLQKSEWNEAAYNRSKKKPKKVVAKAMKEELKSKGQEPEIDENGVTW